MFSASGVVVCGGVHGGQEEDEERTLPRIRVPLEDLPDGFRQAVHLSLLIATPSYLHSPLRAVWCSKFDTVLRKYIILS